jgi:hypothetical protein
MRTLIGALVLLVICASTPLFSQQQFYPVVPADKRGTSDAERTGTHDANNIRTEFRNFGIVGYYWGGGVDLASQHSVEVPNGSGMNYSDGITPFVLAKIKNDAGSTIYMMETGYREGQGTSRKYNRSMRFEPRPDYFNPDPATNNERSPAVSTKPQTWPSTWPYKDTTFNGKWNGYFGTSLAFAPDEESYTAMDDQYYDSFGYTPDSRDATRQGLGLKIEVRGFQWSNPQAGNVIFWHYDIANESTTDYPKSSETENIIFGLYNDTGVGSGLTGCDGDENIDDNAKFDVSSGLNLVYTWDYKGHGVNSKSICAPTGYLGYAYLETPGKPYDNLDNDRDGIINESRDSSAGVMIVGKDAILAYISSHPEKYTATTDFESAYGKIADRPAYKAGVWWTGDEDMDWAASVNDFGEDGEPGTHDRGEGDGRPTQGEQNFGQTDLHESDQIGLTGFRMFRITDDVGGDGGINFTKNPQAHQPTVRDYYGGDYPNYFYDYFSGKALGSDPGPFDYSSPNNMNIGFLFASGPFTLKAGTQERFSLALAFGNDLIELRNTVKVVQTIYNGNYKFATPPPTPTLTAEAGDGYVQLHWNDVAEHSTDPTTNINDFEGYKIYRSTDYNFRDVYTTISARGLSQTNNGNPLAQFDLKDGISSWSSQVVNGLAFNLGHETGLVHSYRDTTVTNGQEYYYAVTAYDYGATIIQGKTGDEFTFYPAESAISVSRTLLGGVTLQKNVVVVRPNAKVAGFKDASASGVSHISGNGTGDVSVNLLNSRLVPSNHIMKVTFNSDPDSVHALSYNLVDSTDNNKVLFSTGSDFDGLGAGISGLGIQPVVLTLSKVQIDTARTRFVAGSTTNAQLSVVYKNTYLSDNFRRDLYPADFTIRFSDIVIDTALHPKGGEPFPVKFTIVTNTPTGEKKVKFSMYDFNEDSTLSYYGNTEEVRILTGSDTLPQYQRETWTITLKSASPQTITPTRGDVFEFHLNVPFSSSDVFAFRSVGASVDPDAARAQFERGPYVVPNPYVGAASFEPTPFGVQGRGDRRMEFRNIPRNATVRIFTVRGELVRTLEQDGSTNGYVPWDMRTKDNLDVAPGLYIFHVDAGNAGTSIGKFAVIK